MKNRHFFERHKKTVNTTLALLFSFLSLAICELLLREFMGLGNPVLYNSSPVYGYRPLPAKEYQQFWGASVTFNNLSLRADRDWNEETHDKILFLGDSVTYGGSYIDNTELFSYRAVEILNESNKLNYIGGNAGVTWMGSRKYLWVYCGITFHPCDDLCYYYYKA